MKPHAECDVKRRARSPPGPDVWGSDQFWAELVQPGRTSKPCVARGVVI